MTKKDDAGRVAAPLTQIACTRRGAAVDVEVCFSCGLPCAAAQQVTGRAPDRDAEWLRSIVQNGVSIF